ncbi:class I SAM-dependent methyltransferase [Chachezhania sediminis]|uniref:class I SAM-dependent methyltransferase n=1 Tax=Chachezhania sediminis TaxID=2599291 RepID=UPI00131E1196|nr:class I SAM-dependent methyltransferase [Chachezhania sediminis]
MDRLRFLVDLHGPADRQGPGSDQATRQAIALSGLAPSPALRIADLGCGTGASALVLAAELGAEVTAIDVQPDFLNRLAQRADAARLADRVTGVEASMTAPPFADGSLDAIWSEGAIYNLGFDEGIARWRRYLKPGGILAVSDLCWLTPDRPAELQHLWATAYPGIGTVPDRIAALEREGYVLQGYFPLDPSCWMENYYHPIEARFAEMRTAHPGDADTARMIEAESREIEIYRRYGAWYSYGFFVARKSDL